MHDPTARPAGLPRPVDGGGAAGVIGRTVPPIVLRATSGEPVDLSALARGTLVLYAYPRTGQPGVDPPAGWDEIPGARGCTPQACAFRDLYDEIARQGAVLVGLSSQTPEYQREAARRLRLPFPLLSDPTLKLARALDLPTFTVDSMPLYERLTLIAREGVIATVFYPVFPPDANAAEVLDWLERHPRQEARE